MSSNTLRRNPTRMALRWKLVPTKNHKKCSNSETLCGVYIGNGCRTCPKCKHVQPPPKKRKRKKPDDGVIDLSKDATPLRKKVKKVPTADGNISKRYYRGDKVWVFWERKKEWFYGRVEDYYRGNMNRDDTYKVNVYMRIGKQQDETWDDHDSRLEKWLPGHETRSNGCQVWRLIVKNSHMKVRKKLYSDNPQNLHRYRVDEEMKWWYSQFFAGNYTTCKNDRPAHQINSHPDIESLYVSFIMNKKWHVPAEYDVKNVKFMGEDIYGACGKHFMFVNLFFIAKDSNNDWAKYRFKSITYFFEEMPKVSGFKYDSVSGKCSSYTYTFKMSDVYWYKLSFKENNGSKVAYTHEANLQLNKALIECKLQALKHPDLWIHRHHIDLKTNNFLYHLEWEMKFKAGPDGGFEIRNCQQENTETNVKRTIWIEDVPKPEPITLASRKKAIEKAIGKHDVDWIESAEAVKEIPAAEKLGTYDNYTFLGMSKFKKPFTDLNERKKFYDQFCIHSEIKRCYHGTDSKYLYPILHPMGGFAMASESNGKCHGHGIYFAKSPGWVLDNGYAPRSLQNMRCIIVADIIKGRDLARETDTHHKNANVQRPTSSIRYSDSSSSTNTTFDAKNFELTGGSNSRGIDVVWYDRAKTDINITHVLWYI